MCILPFKVHFLPRLFYTTEYIVICAIVLASLKILDVLQWDFGTTVMFSLFHL
jgi:hypothetical protein